MLCLKCNTEKSMHLFITNSHNLEKQHLNCIILIALDLVPDVNAPYC